MNCMPWEVRRVASMAASGEIEMFVQRAERFSNWGM